MDHSYPLTRIITIFLDRTPGKPIAPHIREFMRYVLSRDAQRAVLEKGGGYLPILAPEAVRELKKLENLVRCRENRTWHHCSSRPRYRTVRSSCGGTGGSPTHSSRSAAAGSRRTSTGADLGCGRSGASTFPRAAAVRVGTRHRVTEGNDLPNGPEESFSGQRLTSSEHHCVHVSAAA